MKTCANPNCRKGEGARPKQFSSDKEWGLYCDTKCGDAVRRLRHYYKGKSAGEAPTVYEYGPLKFSVRHRQDGWINFVVDGPETKIYFWVLDTGLPVAQMIINVIHGIRDAYLDPVAFTQRAGNDPDSQREAEQLVKVARDIGMPILEASRLV